MFLTLFVPLLNVDSETLPPNVMIPLAGGGFGAGWIETFFKLDQLSSMNTYEAYWSLPLHGVWTTYELSPTIKSI